MSRLTLFDVSGGSARPMLDTEDPARIAEHLARLGVGFERWQADRELAPGADQATILDAYAGPVADLVRRGGYQSADVVRLAPDHPDRAAMRAKFLAEHVHDDDEVRFFVEGAGAFYLRAEDQVFKVVCARGDLMLVPAGQRHWFDMGPEPAFCAIRLFTTPDGWIARFSGDDIATRVPAFPP